MSSTLKLECLDNNKVQFFSVDSSSGVNIKNTINATNSTSGGSLTVAGGASFAKDVYIGSTLNVEKFTLNNIITGVSTIQSASFLANNNVNTPTDVTGLIFGNSDIRNFTAQISVSIVRSSGGSLYESFNIEGMQTDSGWTLYASSVGDISGVTFSITNLGQIQYISTNLSNWTSSVFRYVITKISNTGIYESLSNPTSGTYSLDSLILNNTSPSVMGSNNGSLYLLGGATFEKNLTIKSNTEAVGNGSGGSLTVLGGGSIGKTLFVGTGISTGTLNVNDVTIGNALQATGITTNNINITGDFYKNGVLYSPGSQWSSFANNIIAYTAGNVGINTTTPLYTLDVNGTVNANIYTGGNMRLSGGITAPTVTVTNGIATNISTSTLNANAFSVLGITATNALLTSASGANANFTNITTSNLISVNGITTGNIRLNDNALLLRTLNDANHNISYNTTIDGPRIMGYGGGLLSCGTAGSIVALTWASTGNVGIGTTVPSYKLHVVGDIYSSGDVTAFSDRRKKTDIVTIEQALDKIKKIRGVYFTNLINNRRGMGVIAQEVEEILPEVVLTAEDGSKSVAYGNLVGILTEGIKELTNKIDNYKIVYNKYIQDEIVIELNELYDLSSDMSIYIQSIDCFGQSKYTIEKNEITKKLLIKIMVSENGNYKITIFK